MPKEIKKAFTPFATIAIGFLSGGATAVISALTAGTKIALGNVLVGGLIGAGLGAATNLLMPRYQGPSGTSKRQEANAARRRWSNTVRAPVVPKRWILGRARVGSVLAWIGDDNDGYDLHMALIISEGACEGIEKMWVSKKEVPINFSNDRYGRKFKAALPKDAGRLEGWIYFKGDGTQGASLRAADSTFTSEWKLNGMSWIHIHLNQPQYTQNDTIGRYWTGIPNIEFLVKGDQNSIPRKNHPHLDGQCSSHQVLVDDRAQKIPQVGNRHDSFLRCIQPLRNTSRFQSPPRL